IKLVPELRTNSVTVLAPPSVMGLIEDIIADLDASDPWGRKIEKFRLTNADARQMAAVLQDMFQLEQQGNRLYLVPRPRKLEEGETEEDPFATTQLEPVPDERQQLAITIDVRTNTLLVSATEEYLQRVRGIVEFLDQIDATEREQFVYEFRNAKALEVERVLQSFFQAEAETIRQRFGGEALGSLQSLLEREVTVVGDEDSNKLLVQASPRYVETVKRLVEELDSSPPQVKIQVLLAEVTVDDADTWGVDFDLKEFGGDLYTFSSIATGAGVATAIGLPNLRLSSEDFGLVVRALSVQGKLEILSKPEVTVNNNQSAFIQVGENVTLPAGTTQSGETIRVLTEPRDVGILLNVTPSISSDGFVRMDIAPEISQVSNRTTQISEDFEAPIITQRRVETTVTVRDGQTVIIGGLIQTIQDERETKVPLLGDIPGIGQVFRTRTRENVKTELLVILTPRVVPGGSQDQKSRLNINDMRRYDEAAGKVFGQLREDGLTDQLEEELMEAGYGIIENERGATILVEPTDRPAPKGVSEPLGPPAPIGSPQGAGAAPAGKDGG
ncbi:MAG: secretin N-terminal domain-containing protein, partial [Phycisphaerales bacterium JB039]